MRSPEEENSSGYAANSVCSLMSSFVQIQSAKQCDCVSKKDSMVPACFSPNSLPEEFQKRCTAPVLALQHCEAGKSRASRHWQVGIHSVPCKVPGASGAARISSSPRRSCRPNYPCCRGDEKGWYRIAIVINNDEMKPGSIQ